MHRSDIIINSFVHNECDASYRDLLRLMLHYSFNKTYPYEGYGYWDINVDDHKAKEYISSIYPAKISEIDTYIKQLWNIR